MTRKDYKKLLSIINGFVGGRTVQYKDGNERWKTLNSSNFSYDINSYRLKPELVPFTFEDKDLFKDKWVKFKDDDKYFQIIGVTQRAVFFNNYWFSYERMLKYYVFEDGSPCGKYIE